MKRINHKVNKIILKKYWQEKGDQLARRTFFYD
jgi:hypothetical protein